MAQGVDASMMHMKKAYKARFMMMYIYRILEAKYTCVKILLRGPSKSMY